jgi:fructosamine-3-kinase
MGYEYGGGPPMNTAVTRAIERALGARIQSARPVAGGDINDAFALELDSGVRVFAKTNSKNIRGLFAAEARGLEWLAEAGTLRVPRVLAVGAGDGAGFLVLEWLEVGRRVKDFDERLGRGLAALHRFGAPSFGLDHDNFIGPLHQANSALTTWASFYRERRLGAQLALAKTRGLVDAPLQRDFERLFERMEEHVGPAEPPARLHGDLWAGNLHCDERGQPVLIDPAVYGGHREVDLATMRLFGGYGPRVFEAYDEAYPLADEHEERVALYQLYPLLVHVNLFGAGYLRQLSSALRRLI